MTNRYCRQILAIGKDGQNHLSNSSVLIIGAGGIGSPLLLYLAGAGIGKISIIDDDIVDITNLHRQIIFREKDIGGCKANLAGKILNNLNSDIHIQSYSEKLSLHNAKYLFQSHNLIIDGSDNFQTKYLSNDICCQLNLPLISASIYQSQIQIIKINPKSACYRCLFPTPPPPTLIENCALSGIIGATAGIAGSLTASIAIQLLKCSDTTFHSQLIKLDSDNYTLHNLELSRRQDCPSCINKLINWPSLNFKIDINNTNISEYLIVDLREHSEDRKKTLNSAEIHLPFSSFLKNHKQLPKVRILFYCTHGIRSDYAAYLMREKGFEAWSVSIAEYDYFKG